MFHECPARINIFTSSAFYVILFIFCKYVVKYSYIIVVLDFLYKMNVHVTCIDKKKKVYM